MSNKIDVFISYKREERNLAIQLATALEGSGYTHISDANLESGVNFGDAIEKMINNARMVVVLWTPASVDSDWVKSEARLAIKLGTYFGIIVVPTDLPFRIDEINCHNLHGAPFVNAMPEVMAKISEKLGPATTTPQLAAVQSTTINEDLLFFTTAERTGTLESYSAYLAAFPNGHMATEVRNKVQALDTVGYRIRKNIGHVIATAGVVVALTGVMAQVVLPKGLAGVWSSNIELKTALKKVAHLETVIREEPDQLQHRISELESQLNTATDERARLTLSLGNRLREVTALSGDLGKAQTAFKTSQATIERLKTEKSNDQKASSRAISARNDAKAELAKAELALSAATKERDKTISARATSDKNLVTANAEIAALKTTLSKARIDLLSENTARKRFQTQVSTLTRNVDSAQKEITALQSKIQELAPTPAIPNPDCTDGDGADGYRFGGKCYKKNILHLILINDGEIKLQQLAGFDNLTALSIMSMTVDFFPFPDNLEKVKHLSITGQDYLPTPIPTNAKNFDKIANFTALTYLRISDSEIDDISAISPLKGLWGLDLKGSKVTDVSVIKSLPKLRDLILPDGTELKTRKKVLQWIDQNLP